MLTCDYNGWNDAPEAQREWFDQHQEIWTGQVEQRPMTRRQPDDTTPGLQFSNPQPSK